MEADEINPKGTELLKGIHQLTKASRKSVVTVNDESIYEPLTASHHQLVQGWTAFTTAADALVNELLANLEASTVARLSQLSQLDFRVLAVACTDSGVQSDLAWTLFGRGHGPSSWLKT